MHRFSMTTRGSLASAITSSQAGHTLKDKRAWLKTTLRVPTPIAREQTLHWKGGNSQGLREGALPPIQHRFQTPTPPVTLLIKGLTTSTLSKDVAGIYINASPHSKIRNWYNPYEITHDISHRTRTNNPKIYMEPQTTQNCQSNPEEKEQSWRHNPCKF